MARATVKAIKRKDIAIWTIRAYDTMDGTSRMLKRVMEQTVNANNARELSRLRRETERDHQDIVKIQNDFKITGRAFSSYLAGMGHRGMEMWERVRRARRDRYGPIARILEVHRQLVALTRRVKWRKRYVKHFLTTELE
ncbi:Oidioi.mRNA.OKI2018_I69.chr2.g5900.t2.cds [Oikopleura dioica]|nr:Oidioi.mRNA.OKI2018_I69.chr2.g5900.t2.cds [Oikopleura dioica]